MQRFPLRHSFFLALADFLVLAMLAPCAGAELSAELSVRPYADISISDEEVEAFAARLATAQRTTENTFEILSSFSSQGEARSVDYTVSVFHAQNGIVTVTKSDSALLDEQLAAAGLSDASDAKKIAWTMEQIHNTLDYHGMQIGSYVYSAFVGRAGECNVYNGALCALLTKLGYRAQLVRGYRANSGNFSGHWWIELLTDAEPLVLECGNREDGNWYYLGATYAETHGGDRDYIKCNAYAWNGQPYTDYGAAACAAAIDPFTDLVVLPANPRTGHPTAYQTATLSARIQKERYATVTEVGLLLAPGMAADPLTLPQVASDVVPAEMSSANEGSGFSVFYPLADLGISLSPGVSYSYAFYTVVNGERVVGNMRHFTAPEHPLPRLIPLVEVVPRSTDWQGSDFAQTVLALLLVLGIAWPGLHRAARRRKHAAAPALPAAGSDPELCAARSAP